jgi:diguanylate cyclase
MRYIEDREQSAELFRLALASMGRQSASLNPCSFTLWYEHFAGLNPPLSQALKPRIAVNSLLTNEDVWRLYTEHVVAREVQQYEGLRRELHRILQDTTASTEDAGEKARHIDQALAGYAARLTSARAAAELSATVSDLRNDTGKMRTVTGELIARLQASTEEVAMLTESLHRARREAQLDPLTGLKNRRGFEEVTRQLEEELGGLWGTALLMLDIDHFKVINDEHGHLLGDKVLSAVARVLESSIKGRDVAARLGGEEFGILLPGTGEEGAHVVARQICMTVAKGRIKHSDGKKVIGQVTLSIGVAVGREGESLEQLIGRADAALYTAKGKGRNRVEVADERVSSPA